MFVSDWVPPTTREQGDIHIHGVGHGVSKERSAFRPLIVLVAVVLIAVATMFAFDHTGNRPACAGHATVEPC